MRWGCWRTKSKRSHSASRSRCTFSGRMRSRGHCLPGRKLAVIAIAIAGLCNVEPAGRAGRAACGHDNHLFHRAPHPGPGPGADRRSGARPPAGSIPQHQRCWGRAWGSPHNFNPATILLGLRARCSWSFCTVRDHFGPAGDTGRRTWWPRASSIYARPSSTYAGDRALQDGG